MNCIEALRYNPWMNGAEFLWTSKDLLLSSYYEYRYKIEDEPWIDWIRISGPEGRTFVFLGDDLSSKFPSGAEIVFNARIVDVVGNRSDIETIIAKTGGFIVPKTEEVKVEDIDRIGYITATASRIKVLSGPDIAIDRISDLQMLTKDTVLIDGIEYKLTKVKNQKIIINKKRAIDL